MRKTFAAVLILLACSSAMQVSMADDKTLTKESDAALRVRATVTADSLDEALLTFVRDQAATATFVLSVCTSALVC